MENQIFITYFSNPHKFWYKPFYPGSKKKQLKQLQDAIDEYCDQHYMKQEIVDYEPIFGEVVAYFDPLLARWTRCSVEGIKEEDKRMRSYRLWLIDEGYPKVVDMEHLKPLPEKFHDKSSTIVKQGAIKNIIPGHCVYDPLVEELRKTVCFSWNKQATDVIHSLIKGTQKICFTNFSTYPFGKESICIGDLLFHVNTKTFNASAVLSEWAMGLIVDSEAFTNYMFESKEILSSKASSLVSASLDDTKSLSYEQLFDDSASTVGETTTQKPLVDESLSHSEVNSNLSSTKIQHDKNSVQGSEAGTKTSKLRRKIQLQMAQKLKQASGKNSEEQTPAKPAVQTTSSPTLCKTIARHLPDAHDPLAQIRMSPQSLTIDVAQATQTEYELMHMKLTKASTSEANSHTTTPELVPKTPDAPTMPDQAHNESSDKVGTAPKFMRKIIKMKANLNQQKLINPVPEQSAPSTKGLSPAGVPISSLLSSEKLPTSESNAALKRFEKVIQDEKW